MCSRTQHKHNVRAAAQCVEVSWTSAFLLPRVLTDVLFLLFVPSALKGVQHVTICAFQFCKSFLSCTCCFHSAGTCPLVLSPKNWDGLGSAGGGLPSTPTVAETRRENQNCKLPERNRNCKLQRANLCGSLKVTRTCFDFHFDRFEGIMFETEKTLVKRLNSVDKGNSLPRLLQPNQASTRLLCCRSRLDWHAKLHERPVCKRRFPMQFQTQDSWHRCFAAVFFSSSLSQEEK